MGYLEFSSDGIKSLIVTFDCDKCQSRVTSEEMRIPTPNLWAEKASDSHGENYCWVECEECGKDFTVSVNVGWSDSYIDIDDVDDESITIEVIEEGDYLYDYAFEQIEAIDRSENYYIQFQREISNLKTLNAILIEDEMIQETLRRQVFSGAITCLEDYLSTTLIQLVLNDENHFKNFVKTYDPIKNRKFELGDIFEHYEKLRDIVKIELTNVIYHDLVKVRNMYRSTLKISFPFIGDLMKIIIVRHHMVHRNGRTKEGEKIDISKSVVYNAIEKVEVLVNEIELEINKLNPFNI
ncbi:MAG: hypothetical protein ACO1N0_12165 [Fluviicola sp.]